MRTFLEQADVENGFCKSFGAVGQKLTECPGVLWPQFSQNTKMHGIWRLTFEILIIEGHF